MTWDVQADISRVYLGMGTLLLMDTLPAGDPGSRDPNCPYVIGRDGIGPGSVTWRKATAQSPFVSGRYVIGQVKDQIGTTLTIRVRGSSYDWMDYHLQQLIQAFEQPFYGISLTINGVNHQWHCEAADWALGDGGQYQSLEAMSYTQLVKFSIQRHPVPIVGRF